MIEDGGQGLVGRQCGDSSGSEEEDEMPHRQLEVIPGEPHNEI